MEGNNIKYWKQDDFVMGIYYHLHKIDNTGNGIIITCLTNDKGILI